MFEEQETLERDPQQTEVAPPVTSKEEDLVPIPRQWLLGQYRRQVAELTELTRLLGAETLGEFGEELHRLAQAVSPSAPVATAAAVPEQAETPKNELPVEQRPEIVAMIQAVQQNPDSIRRMSNLPEVVLIAAVDRMGTAIRHIVEPSVAVQMAAVRRNPWAIKRIKRPSREAINYVLEKAPELQSYFDRLTGSRRQHVLHVLGQEQTE